MNTRIFTITAAAALAPVLAAAQPAHADQAPRARPSAAATTPSSPSAVERPVTLDVELDPIAYAASGYSLHVGLSHGRYRLDLGAFAADLPELLHGNDGFEVAMHGFGAKLDRFWRRDRTGFFAGVEAGVLDYQVVDGATRMVEQSTRLQGGARVGWRFALPADFHVTPWVGVGYALGAGDRTIAGRTFEESPVVVFPTVHLGRTF
jgi:hypothetical protein